MMSGDAAILPKDKAAVGVIGVGWWSSQAHLPALSMNENAHLAAIADLDIDKLKQAKDTFNISKTYTDYIEMFKKEDLDGVVIAVPHKYHYEIALAASIILKDGILGKTRRKIPTMLDYKTHISKGSMFNTPPVFAIYVSMLTLQWLKDNGGVEWIEKINQQKADLLYNEIDRNPLFEGTANKEDRSNMNVTFLLTDNSKEDQFNEMWTDAGINGLKGHRSVGGYRASMYNALPIESVQLLVEIMQKLAQD